MLMSTLMMLALTLMHMLDASKADAYAAAAATDANADMCRINAECCSPSRWHICYVAASTLVADEDAA